MKTELKTNNLSVTIDGNSILKNIDFTLPPGITMLIGSNGAGKTTLLRTLCGLTKPCGGSVIYDNKDMGTLSRKEIAKAVCFIPGQHAPVFSYSLLDFVVMGTVSQHDLFHVPNKKDEELALQKLEMVGLKHLAKRDYLTLSAGERQLSLLARGLTQQSAIMLLDEPTANLDFVNTFKVLEKLTKIKEKAMLITTHDPNLALKYAQHVAFMKDGELLGVTCANEVGFKGKFEGLLSRTYGADVVVRMGETVVLR